MSTAISYNSFNLQTTNYITSDIEDAATPERELNIYTLIRTGGGIVTNSDYYTKRIIVSGRIEGSSVSNLETLIDSFHAAMSTKDKNLDIAYGGATRRYAATPEHTSIQRPVRAAPWAKFRIEFVATSYGQDTTVTTLLNNESVTSSPNTEALSIAGSAPEQLLRIEITISALTGSGSHTIALENDTTGQILTIDRTWTATEVLLIDVANREVRVDNVITDYNGAFPVFMPGNHNLIITSSLPTFTFSVDCDYYKRYL